LEVTTSSVRISNGRITKTKVKAKASSGWTTVSRALITRADIRMITKEVTKVTTKVTRVRIKIKKESIE
jgi:hypothetical protein